MFAINTPPVANSSFVTTRFSPRRWPILAASWLWHWLRRPWLAIVAGLIGVTLALASWQLPQLPGQLVDEQAAEATWLLNTSTAYGLWGNPFLALGLFDVLRSPLLYLLLALLVPTLAAHLADQLGALHQVRGVQRVSLTTPAPSPAEAIRISTVRSLFRWRGILLASPAVVTSTLEGAMQAEYAKVERAEAPLLSLPLSDADSEEETLPVVESRLLSYRFPRLHYVRPLLMVGLLVAVAGAWIALAFGWQVTAPPLAPGATFRSANRNLVLHYSVSPTGTLQTALEASLQGEQVLLDTAQATQERVGSATIQVRPSYPGVLVVTADGGERLSLPGESNLRSAIGLVFATPGREESVLIPDQGVGLRIIQKAESDGFVLELYRSETIQPVYRAELTQGGQWTIPFGPGDTELMVSTRPGLQVDVRHLPGLWLVPLGVLLALIGAVAFLRHSAFVLAQVAPWSTERTTEHTVVVLQSDHPDIIAELRAALATLSPPPQQVAESRGDEAVPPQSQAHP